MGGTQVSLSNMIRRLAVRAAGAVTRWQLSGHEDDQGNEEGADDVEVYQQVGFASRPKAGTGKTTGIVASIAGSARNLLLIAARDVTGRPTVDEDETAIHNSKTFVRITKDGDVIVRVATGRTVTIDDGSGAVLLATKADLDNLKTAINGWTPVPNDGGAALKTALTALFTGPPTWPAGTTVLKGK
jgi:phage gp45-like